MSRTRRWREIGFSERSQMKDGELFGAAIVDECDSEESTTVQTLSVITRMIGTDFERLELRSRDVSRRRTIRGVASTGRAVGGVSLSSMGCIARLPLPLLHEHGNKKSKRNVDLDQQRIGVVTLIEMRPSWLAIEAAIDSSRAGDHAWRQIESGAIKALSVHPADMVIRGCVSGALYAEQWTLREISIGRVGKNPDCFLRITGNFDRDFYDFSDQ